MKYHLYIVSASDFIKVGYSEDMKSRLCCLQTSNPHRVEVIKTWGLKRRRIAMNIERSVHKQLAREGITHRGEWYRSENADYVMRVCQQFFQEINTPLANIKLRKRPKNKLIALSSKEKMIIKRARIAEAKEIARLALPRTRKEAIRNAISPFRQVKIAKEIGIDSRVIFRFVHRGVDMPPELLDRCHEWLNKIGKRVEWRDS